MNIKLSYLFTANTIAAPNLFFKNALCSLLLTLGCCEQTAFAQLNADGDLYKISQSGTYHDETIPSGGGLNGNNYLTFTLKGGDGGAYKGIFNERKGGGGATVRASFQIGTGAGQLQPGGVVRFVVGHHGSTIRRGIISGAGGGGGTAVLYHHPNATITCTDPSTDLADANSCWVILAVAGGGGGAYASDIAGSGSNGKNATGGECGLPGLGSGHGEGGCNGNGGESGNDGVTNTGGGGGGALTDGLGGDGTGGNAGGFTGGEGGDDYINGGKGGFGYGGGGYGVGAGHPSGGGGGGGYSGGGGAYTNPGGGGGSFANDDAEEVDKKDGKVDSSPDHGKVHYQFAVKDGPTAKCKDVEVTLVNGSATIHVNDVNNGSFAEPDNFVLEKLFVPSETLTLTFDCSHVGDNTVQLSIKSTSQKYDYCTATVEVLDEVPPTINCITETIGVELDANFEYVLSVAEIESGTASDACGMVVDKYLHNDTLTCDSIGTRTVYLTAEDDNGNTSFCSATVNVLPSTTANSRFYVDANATGSNDGSSWTNAFNLLQDALAASQICQNPTDIWVADGTYYPDEGGGNTDNNRQSTFTIYPNVSLYGGFAGGETSLSQRNWETNVAILSGDLMQDDGADFASNGDNAYHVVSGQGDLTGNTLDGFTITAGNANVSQFVKSGAGIYLQQNGGLTISNCKVIANKADITGAGLYIVNSNTTSIQVVNCWFGGNRAGGSGGGVYIGGQGTSADFINVLFSGNWSPKGSAVAATGALSNTNLINCTVAANNSTTGSALYHNDSNVTTFNVTNSIVWGNESAFTAESGAIFNVNYSIVQGGFIGTDNLEDAPAFVNLPDFNTAPTTTGDFHLQNCSPAIDAGTSTGAPTDDLVGDPRPANAGYDMGSYEYQGSPSPGITCFADSDGDNYGDAAVTQVFCGACGTGFVTDNTDCDDTESAINPNATEICDGIDNNCNTQTDENQVCCPAGNIIYVDANAVGNNDGKTWTDAFNYLQDALALAPTCSSVTEIWVADGTYYPDEGGGMTDNDPAATFMMIDGIAIYGGFAGVETMLSERDWETNVTILSGDLMQDDEPNFANNGDNAWHVVLAAGATITASAILDGFTVTGGFANGPNININGGGMFIRNGANPSVSNCFFLSNTANVRGGGMAILFGSSPSITACTFSGNTSPNNGGGGLDIEANSAPTLLNCSFLGNSAAPWGGGIMNINNSDPTLINCLFLGNTANTGGAVYNQDATSSPAFVNCSFSGNSANIGGALRNLHSTSLTMTNCIVWGNSSEIVNTNGGNAVVTNSTIQGGYPGTDNLDLDPLFVSQPDFNNAPTTAGDLRLQECSPAIDFGDNAANSTSEDLEGNPRIVNSFGSPEIDMGAYEYQLPVDFCDCYPFSGNVLYVDKNATGAEDGTSWTDAFTTLQEALDIAYECPTNVAEIWVAAGTYYPDEGAGYGDNERDASFFLLEGMNIYGGFAGGETLRSQRDWENNVTILSGDLMKNDGANFSNTSDNAYHVLGYLGGSEATRLDGFTISGGNADLPNMFGIPIHNVGGGLLSVGPGPLTVANCRFLGNQAYDYGGAVFTASGSAPAFDSCEFVMNYAYDGGAVCNEMTSPTYTNCLFENNWADDNAGAFHNYLATPTLTDCIFKENHAENDGGAMFNEGSDCTISRCIFTENTVDDDGGAIYNLASNPAIANCLFSQNTSGEKGGAMYNDSSEPDIVNSTFAFNAGEDGGGMYNQNSSGPDLTNLILWGNTSTAPTSAQSPSIFVSGNSGMTANNSLAEFWSAADLNTTGGTGNLDSTDPLFISMTDLQLQSCSPAIDVGTATGAPTDDLNGNARPAHAGFDLGAYELQGTPIMPVAVCQNRTVQLDASGHTTFGVGQLNNGSTGCDPLAFAVGGETVLNYNCSDVGPHTVTLTVTDNLNNTNTCTATVTVEDNILPFADCKIHTVQLDASGSGSLLASEIDNGSVDACGIASLSASPNVFGCTEIGPNTVTLTVTDDNGNMSTCTSIVTVEDNVLPTADCQPHTVQLDASGSGSLTANDIDNGSSDACGTASLSASPNTFTCGDIGTNNVTLTVTDNNGKVNTCIATVTVEDNVLPTANCKPYTVQLNANGNGSLTANDIDNSSADACGIASLSASPNTFNCSDVGTNNVTLTVTDNNGKVNTCTATVTVEDNVLPTANCQPYTVQLNASGNGSLTANNIDNGSTDACGIASISASPNTFTCADVGANIVTLTVTDNNGNTNTCNTTVTVEDNVAPSPTCKTTTVHLDAAGHYTLLESDVLASNADNCSNTNFWYMTPSMVDCGDIGPAVAVAVYVFDASGNQASCTANVTVEDHVLPTANCMAQTIQLDASGSGSLTATDIDNGSSDACGITSISASPNVFACANVGANMVTLTVEDSNGNTSTCTATVSVEDSVLPMANCKPHTVQLDANGDGSITASDIDNSSSDACGIASISASPNTFDCTNVETNTVTLTVTDNNGNVSTCSSTVTVVDNIAPLANCVSQTIQATLDTNGQYTVDPNQLNDNSADACGIQSLSASPSILDCQHEGTNAVTLTVADVNGNTSTCTATVEVAGFVTIDEVDETPESCAGMADGGITITATAGGGQVGYSIDGGQNFSFINVFQNLSPGNYDIVVKVFGVPSICEKTTTATIEAGGVPTTWYKDTDGDGYTDGNTLTGCSQPLGYILNPLPGTDCDDNDPSEFPGQIWYGDTDADGYGSGDTQSACQRPTGFFLPSELAELDTDCDDNEPAVNPAAAEICDGLDNDCNGETDEGLSETYVGNVLFTTQAQLDAWAACYDIIDGNVTIQGGNITDLGPLSNIVEITGNLMIITSFTLTTLDGLENLAIVGGSLFIYYNFQLSDCCAIYGLLDSGGVGASVVIYLNKVGCNSQAQVLSNCAPNNPLVVLPGASMDTQSSFLIPESVRVYPNPTTGAFTLVLPKCYKEGKVGVTDLYGRKIIGKVIEEDQAVYQFDAGLLKPGIYMVVIRTPDLPVQSLRLVVD